MPAKAQPPYEPKPLDTVKVPPFTSLEQLPGRTITKVMHDDEQLALLLDDGTHFYIKVVGYEESQHLRAEPLSFEGDGIYVLEKLGVITREWRESFFEERRRQAAERGKREERELFERLKAVYEPK